jgi:hypothetical protein
MWSPVSADCNFRFFLSCFCRHEEQQNDDVTPGFAGIPAGALRQVACCSRFGRQSVAQPWQPPPALISSTAIRQCLSVELAICCCCCCCCCCSVLRPHETTTDTTIDTTTNCLPKFKMGQSAGLKINPVDFICLVRSPVCFRPLRRTLLNCWPLRL